MKIIKLVLGACHTNCYIVASEQGNAERLIQSINRLAREFMGNYKILTGYREETTLEHERRFSPFIEK